MLQRMQPVASGEAFNCGNLLLSNIPQPRDARAAGLPLNQYRACAALTFAAAILRSGQVEMVAQDKLQARLGIGVGRIDLSIDMELPGCGH